MKPVHHRSLARLRLAKLTLPSPSLIEFLPAIIPSRFAAGKSHARRRGGACIPGAGLRTVPLIAAVAPRRQTRGVTCPVADRAAPHGLCGDERWEYGGGARSRASPPPDRCRLDREAAGPGQRAGVRHLWRGE